jgi:hypothetical protein
MRFPPGNWWPVGTGYPDRAGGGRGPAGGGPPPASYGGRRCPCHRRVLRRLNSGALSDHKRPGVSDRAGRRPRSPRHADTGPWDAGLAPDRIGSLVPGRDTPPSRSRRRRTPALRCSGWSSQVGDGSLPYAGNNSQKVNSGGQ